MEIFIRRATTPTQIIMKIIRKKVPALSTDPPANNEKKSKTNDDR